MENIIQVEEKIYGFSLFNKGNDLKKSLIDTNKVKDYIKNIQSSGDYPVTSSNAIL